MDSLLLISFKFHYRAYLDKSLVDYRDYRFNGYSMEGMASATINALGCDWKKFKKNVIEEGTPPNYSSDAAFLVGLWVCAFIWWYVNRFSTQNGQDGDRFNIKKMLDELWSKGLITKTQYFIYDNELFETFDKIADEFCSKDIVNQLNENSRPKRSIDRVYPNQRAAIGGLGKYKISKRQFDNARKLGVTIKPSVKANKKIDVYKGGNYILSIGDINYNDYDTYLSTMGKSYADKRRKAYKSRHEKDRKVLHSAGYYADRILW